jgi:hypothetical protein
MICNAVHNRAFALNYLYGADASVVLFFRRIIDKSASVYYTHSPNENNLTDSKMKGNTDDRNKKL